MNHFIKINIGNIETLNLFHIPDNFLKSYIQKINIGESSLIDGNKEIISFLYEFNENNEFFELKFFELEFECITSNPLNYKLNKNLVEILKVNKTTKERLGNIDVLFIPESLEASSILSILSFISEIIETESKEIKDFLNYLINVQLSYSVYNLSINNYCLLNILKLSFININEVEKILNSNNEKIIIKNIKKSSFTLNTESKLSKSVGLPNFAITSLKKERLEANLDYFTQINELVDGNDLKMLLDLFKNSKKILTLSYLNATNQRKNNMVASFLKYFISLIKGDYMVKYKTKELLNYLLKQSMYYGHSDKFKFPFEEIKLLNDYLNMCSINNITADKFPQNLRKAHNILVINTTSIANIDETQFINEVTKYKKYEMTLDGFKFISPKKPYDLLEEGTKLHHCISSYAFNVANGKNIIFFMRDEKSPDVPMITIEINEKKDIIEIKEIYNVEPDIKYKKIANKWAGLCKKIK